MKKISGRSLAGILLLAFLVIAAIYVYFNNPEGGGWFPKCSFYLLTGLKCPSCGNTRATFQLMHGNFVEALHFNPFIVIAFPLVLVICYIYFFKPKWVDEKWLGRLCWSYIALYLVWWVVRNIIGV